MRYQRFGRIQRNPSPAPLQKTERDFKILEKTALRRSLLTRHYVDLLGESPEKISKRLRRLFDHGYLERRMMHLETVHLLGKRGAKYLCEHDAIPYSRLDWLQRHEGNESLEHATGIAEFMIQAETSAKKHRDIDFIDSLPLKIETFGKPKSFVWNVRLHYEGKSMRVTIIPDEAFALVNRSNTSHQKQTFFFEFDRGTVPITSRNFARSSNFKKLIAYQETWRQKTLSKYVDNFRIIFLTTNATRVGNLIDASQVVNAGRGSGLFLFTDLQTFREHDDLFALPFLDGRGEVVYLHQ